MLVLIEDHIYRTVAAIILVGFVVVANFTLRPYKNVDYVVRGHLAFQKAL